MAEVLKPDICVIGAGAAGLSIAAGAGQLGAETVLIEQAEMGGDCLNRGCVPSKALLAAAHAAHVARTAAGFGVDAAPRIDFARVHDHVHQVIAAIAPTDSVDRYEGFGVRVIRSAARFVGTEEVLADGLRIRARRFVVATGSRPAVPAIPGLDGVAYRTNETIFDDRIRPDHLIVIGGGPIGCELAQAYGRLGARVSVLEMHSILPKDDPELVDVVRRRLQAEGVEVYESSRVLAIEPTEEGVAVSMEKEGERRRVDGTLLLVAAGRRPDVEGLDLDAAGVVHTPRGITVDSRLRTSNPRVYAVGDVTGGLQFTHMAGYQAGIVIRNALFRLPAKMDLRAVPWVTYTDPELAHVGMNEATAREKLGDIRVLRSAFAENDRAQTERATEGFAKIVVTPHGRVVGASIVGQHAGELIHSWVLAIERKLKIKSIANMIAPYPTRGEVGKRAAGAFYAPLLFSNRTRQLVRLLGRLG